MGLRPVCMLLHKTVVHDSRVRREAAALAASGRRVVVLELDRDARGTLDGFERRSAAPAPWVRRVLPFQLYRAVFLATFVREIARLRPGVVHAHDAAMLLPGLLGARLVGARLVYDSHELATGVPYRDRRWGAFVALVERLAVPRADAVITVTGGIAERLRDHYGLAETPAVVRNVCALEAGAPDGTLRARLGIGDAPLVLHQGAAAPERGCETLVRAIALVPEAQLVFLGTGEPGFDAALAELAAGLGVRERVHLCASIPLEELLSRTAEADVGVTLLQDTCENHRLALPNKLFEYVAAGVPVVASDLPELRRAMAELGAGRVVDAGSPEAVAAALRAALAERGGEAVRAASERARSLLSWEHERERLLAVYERALG
jgi:glycosyltransferase involved in cell wall biosynthesis